MNRFLAFLLLIVTAAVSAAPAQRDAFLTAVDYAAAIEIYSLDPGEHSRDSDGQCIGECFHGWPVLGHAPLTGNSRKTILDSLRGWVKAPEPDAVAMCFSPRHAARVSFNDQVFDYLLCFECGHGTAHGPEGTATREIYRVDAPEVWNKALEALHIPVAQAPAED